MGHNIEFTPDFEFRDWVDGVDRVTASGENGFNARFRSLQDDLETLSQRVAELNAALNDDRDQVHTGFSTVTDSCVLPGAFEMFAVETGNNLLFRNGVAIIEGRPARSSGPGFGMYSTQPWTDQVRAAADGVPVIPPLTTPSTDRVDTVYLDTWERTAEVNGLRRLVREVAVRVNEGSSSLPSPLPGHQYMVVAFLNRKAGVALFTNDAIQDVRPLADRGPKQRAISPPPLLHAQDISGWKPWKHIVEEFVGGRVFAFSPSTEQNTGMLPLLLPSGARRLEVVVEGRNQVATGASGLNLALRRSTSRTLNGSGDVATDVVPPSTSFLRTMRPPNDFVVDSDHNSLYLFAFAGVNSEVEITRVTVSYTF